MRKLLLLITALLTLGVSGAWASDYAVPSALKVNTITTGGYYLIDGLAQDNTTGHYLYDNGTKVTSGTPQGDATVAKFMWKIVGNTIDGYTLQNKSTGNYMSLGSSNGSAISTGSTPQANVIYFNGDSYATICNSTTNQAIDVGASGTNPTTWAGSTTEVTGSRRLMIYDASVLITENTIYTIKASFTSNDYTDLYFYNNNGVLAFNGSITNGVNSYWVARPSGNSTYPWKFETGCGSGKFLSPATNGLSNNGGWFQVPYCTGGDNTSKKYVHLYGSYADASTSNIRNLGTWSPDGSNHYSGFANSGPNTGCFGGAHVNSGYQWTTDYIIEEVPNVELYTIISNLDDGGVTYTPSYTGVATQTNGGFYILASAPSPSDFTAKEVTNYTPGAITVDATAKTITVNYTADITYTLKDMNEATYSWSASGSFGTAPTLTGCAGYTLSNEAWDEENRTYTADITFPFPVSSKNVTNWTYIGNFATSSNNYATSSFCWFVKSSDATKVYSGQDKLPTNQSGEQEKWEWSITPTFTAGAFSFTIKNASTNKYVTMAASPAAGFSDQISLTDIGTAFTFDASHRWKLPTATELYISQNSSSATEQEVGVYGPNGAYGAHSGNYIAFITPADFTSLMSELKAARTSFTNYFLYWSQEKYTEAVEGTMANTYDKLAEDRNVVKDPPTEYFTAAQFKTYTDAYKNAVAGLRYVMPTFFRVKNLDGTKYVKTSSLDYANYVQLDFSAGGNDATSIFYLNASNNIMSYYSGMYLFAVNHTCPVSWTNYHYSYEFLPGSSPSQIYVHVVDNPSGWGGEEKYWSGAGDKMGRVVTPTAESDLLIEEVTSLPVTFKGQFASFFSPVDLTLADGVKAYTGTLNGDNTILTLTEVDYVPANTGVILEYEAFSSETTLNFPILSTVTPIDDTSLTGSTAAQSVDADSKLVLGKSGDNWGIYKYSGTTLGGFKAYMDMPETPVKGFAFTFGDADAIANVLNGEENTNEVYDLSGRRVNAPARGLYIVNGKKVVIK